VYFTSLKDSGTGLALQGVAQSNARVSALMRNLASSDWFADPELEIIRVKSVGSDRVSEFSLKVKQVAKKEKKLTDTDAGT
ncbi:MAG: PilN domain-containing protein, partial [Bacteroidota bacterium]